MRPLSVVFAIGMTALASAAQAQESICNPCIDVPADYQALKPLATDWPRPSEALNFYRVRYNMGATGPSNLRSRSEVMRLRNTGELPLIDSRRIAGPAGAPVDGTAPGPAGATAPTDPALTAEAPPASDSGRTGENAP